MNILLYERKEKKIVKKTANTPLFFLVSFTQSAAKLERHLRSSTIYSVFVCVCVYYYIVYDYMIMYKCTRNKEKKNNQLLQFVMMLIIIWSLFADIYFTIWKKNKIYFYWHLVCLLLQARWKFATHTPLNWMETDLCV